MKNYFFNIHKRGLLFILSAAFGFILLQGCKGSSANNGEQAGPPPAPNLPVFTASAQPATTYQDFPATVQGKRDIEIRPQVDGYLTAILVDEGAYVHQGQPLFSIDKRPFTEQLNTANANVLAATAALENAQINVDKLKPLVQNNVISDVQLKSAQASYNAAKANLAQAQAAVESARINLGYTTIASPGDGFIGRLPFKTGSLVTKGMTDALTILSETKEMRVYFSLSENDFLKFKEKYSGNTIADKVKGMPGVELVLPDNSVYPQKGKVELVEGQFNKTVGAINFRASFPNEQGTLRSGNTGKIRIPTLHANELAIPQEATFEIQDKVFVYTIDDSSKVSTRPITISGRTENYYFISEGIKAGDKIVLSYQSTMLMGGLRDGMKIQPQMVSTDSLPKQRP